MNICTSKEHEICPLHHKAMHRTCQQGLRQIFVHSDGMLLNSAFVHSEDSSVSKAPHFVLVWNPSCKITGCISGSDQLFHRWLESVCSCGSYVRSLFLFHCRDRLYKFDVVTLALGGNTSFCLKRLHCQAEDDKCTKPAKIPRTRLQVRTQNKVLDFFFQIEIVYTASTGSYTGKQKTCLAAQPLRENEL